MLRSPACLALALALLLLLASAAPPVPAEAAATHPRVVLLELHTAVWCPGCAVADAAVERLHREHGDALAVVAYHPGFWVGDGAPDPRRDDWSVDDPLGTPEVDAYQRNATDELVFPTVVVNGVDARVGPATVERNGRTEGDVDATAALYREMVAVQRGDSPVGLALAPVEVGNATVNLTATVTPPPGAANLTLRLVLFESSVWWWGWNGDGTPEGSTNGVRLHHFTARALTPPMAIAGNDTSSTTTHAVTLPRDARWDPAHLGAAAFVRDNATGAVVQAAAQYPDAGGGTDDAPPAGALAAAGGLVLAAVWRRRWSGGGVG